VRGILGSFLFRKDEIYKKTEILSGGEKTRLNLIKFLVDPPNLLLMDEPTTHLDIQSIDALVMALKAYEGTLIFISHDVHFIKALAKNVLHVHSGKLTHYAGDYDYYLEKSKFSDARAALTSGLTDNRPKQVEAKKAEPVKSGPVKAKPSANEIRKFREHVGVLEKKVVDLETKQAEITAALESPETYADKGKFQHLNRELSAMTDLITAATAEWEKATDQLAEMEKA